MNIVAVGPVHPYRGGIAHFLEILCEGMSDRGHSVSAVTFTRQYPELLFPGKTQLVESADAPPFPISRQLDTLNPLSWWHTARDVAGQQPDVVLFKYWMPFFAPAFGTIARYARSETTRILTIVDNAIPHEQRPGDNLLTRFFLNACDGHVVMSDTVSDDLDTLNISVPRKRVNHPTYEQFGDPPPCDAARAELGISGDTPLLLFFGFVRRYKGLHVLLEALPQILNRLPDLQLIVAGEFYDDRSFYEEIVQRHGLHNHVTFRAEYIPEDDVATYFSAADLLVQPYVSATQSGVAQIAFHYEQPLIVSDVGGLPEMIEHEKVGFVVPSEDPQALAAAVVRYFEEDWEERLTSGLRSERKAYGWNQIYDAIEELAAV